MSSNAPTAEELAGTALHLVGRLDPSETLTAARYVAMAHAATAAIPADRPLVLTAGTGMYLKAFLENLDLGGMGAVPELRETLEAEAARDLPGLARRLAELSPGLAAATDLRNPARVVRRMELLAAAAFAEDARDARDTAPGGAIEALKVGLAVPTDLLEMRLADRIDRMLTLGWAAEVRALLENEPAPCAQVLNSIGVAEMSEHLAGEIDEATLRRRVLVRTRQYAKRQRTWFRGDPGVTWLDVGNRSPSDIVETILGMMN